MLLVQGGVADHTKYISILVLSELSTRTARQHNSIHSSHHPLLQITEVTQSDSQSVSQSGKAIIQWQLSIDTHLSRSKVVK